MASVKHCRARSKLSRVPFRNDDVLRERTGTRPCRSSARRRAGGVFRARARDAVRWRPQSRPESRTDRRAHDRNVRSTSETARSTSMSCAVTRRRSSDRRTLPSIAWVTPSRRPMALMSPPWLCAANADVREDHAQPGKVCEAVDDSPRSAHRRSSGSSLVPKLANGSTTTLGCVVSRDVADVSMAAAVAVDESAIDDTRATSR